MTSIYTVFILIRMTQRASEVKVVQQRLMLICQLQVLHSRSLISDGTADDNECVSQQELSRQRCLLGFPASGDRERSQCAPSGPALTVSPSLPARHDSRWGASGEISRGETSVTAGRTFSCQDGAARAATRPVQTQQARDGLQPAELQPSRFQLPLPPNRHPGQPDHQLTHPQAEQFDRPQRPVELRQPRE